MQNYSCLTSFCLKTNKKYKVIVVRLDLKCLQEFAIIVAAFGFESSVITALLKRDLIYAYI